MSVSTLETPFVYAGQLLDVANAAIGDTIGGPIDRVYVSPGRPAFDCEQLTVHLESFGDFIARRCRRRVPGRTHIIGKVNMVGFVVTIVRDCVPTMDDRGNPPSPDDIEAAAEEIAQDVWAVWTGVYNAKREDSLFGGRCDYLFYDGADVLETEGTFAAWELRFRAEIAGIISVGS